MSRLVLFVCVLAFLVYALVDLVLVPRTQLRALNKPLWAVLIVLLPVVGAAMWFFIGRGKSGGAQPSQQLPEEPASPRERGGVDRIADLERRLRELDEEVYPGEQPRRDRGDGGVGDSADADQSNNEGMTGAGKPADGERPKQSEHPAQNPEGFDAEPADRERNRESDER